MGFFQRILKKHRDRINFNKEILFAEIGALAFGPAFAEISSFFTTSNPLIALCATAGDYLGYTLMYASMTFYDNKKLYWQSKKKKISPRFFRHMLKFIGGAVGVDVIYYSARTYMAYVMLSSGIAPYLAVFISQLVTLVLYILLLNVMGSFLGIVKKER